MRNRHRTRIGVLASFFLFSILLSSVSFADNLSVSALKERLYPLKKDGKYGFIDEKGKWGCIDRKGE